MLIEFFAVREGALLPTKATIAAAGYDLAAHGEYYIAPGKTVIVWTGLRLAKQPFSVDMAIRPRSSLYKTGLIIPNAPGTLDGDYTGEIGILVSNVLSPTTVTVHHGQRLAQLVLTKPVFAELAFAEQVDSTADERGGFGSTGV
jgi:dUTP pyrophosphatase